MNKNTHNKLAGKRAAFLDRDGVINIDINYCHQIDEFQFIPGIFKVLELLQKKFDHLFIITNQAGIARGYYSEEQFQILTKWMLQQLKSKGIHITQVYYCPHHPSGIAPYNIDCDCRKPKPGMILQAIQEYSVDPAQSIFIGDKLTDIQAARAAHLAAAYLVGTDHPVSPSDISQADSFFNNMDQLTTAFST